MTVNVVTNAAPVEAYTAAPRTAPAEKTAPRIADTAHISESAVLAAKGAAAEATETKEQTAREAAAGDQQAQRLIAQYAAAQGG
jgi:hypothetical protein